jgi:Arc/MetJ family transcription regulator
MARADNDSTRDATRWHVQETLEKQARNASQTAGDDARVRSRRRKRDSCYNGPVVEFFSVSA